MKKSLLFIFALVSFAVMSAQTPKLTVSYMDNAGQAVVEEMSLAGGAIEIKDNEIKVVVPGQTDKIYAFDKVTKLLVSTVTTDVNNLVSSTEWSLEPSGVLRLKAEKPLGNITVYSVTGVQVTKVESTETEALIDLSGSPKGIYVVQTDNGTIKIVK